MSSPNGYNGPSIFGRSAGLPAWIWQSTDPGGEDFQRSFRSTLEFLRDLGGGVTQTQLSNRVLADATGLTGYGGSIEDPRLVPGAMVEQEAKKSAMKRIGEWFSKLANPDGDRNTLDDLVGQARAHDIADPESWNPQQLAQEVERRRTDRFLQNFDSNTKLKTVGKLAEFTALGAAKSFVDIARDVPFIGDWASSFESVRNADKWLSQMQEMYRTGPAGDVGDRLAEGLGNAIGYSAASYLAWQGIGLAAVKTGIAAAPIATRMPAIAKMALQGGADAWILQGGGDKPLEERAYTILGGTTLGAIAGAGGPVIGGAAAGGAIGAISGYALEHDPEDAAIGFGIGVTIGAGAGALQAARALRGRAQQAFPESEVGTYRTPLDRDRMLSAEGEIPYADYTVMSGQLESGNPFLPQGQYEMGPVRLRLNPGQYEAGPGYFSLGSTSGPVAPAPTFAEPNVPFSSRQAAVDVEGTTGLQVSRVHEPLNTPEERAQIEIQRRVSAARAAGVPLDVDAIGRQYQELLNQDPRYTSEAPGLRNKQLPQRDARGRFVSAKKGAAISKQEAILTSPALAELGQKPSFDEADVLKALQQNTPGQTVVVNDIKDPGTFAMRASERGRDLMREEGFNTDLTLYHGTDQVFDEFIPRKNEGIYLTPKPEIAASYTNLLDYAARVAGVEGVRSGSSPNIRPVYVRLRNPLIHDFEGETDYTSASAIVRRAREAGHDGVILRNVLDVSGTGKIPTIELYRQTLRADGINTESMTDRDVYEYMLDDLNNPLIEGDNETPQDQIVVFDPANIRSKFWAPDELLMTQLPNGKVVATVGNNPEHYAQLEKFGAFAGQQVRTPDGVEGVVEQVGPDVARVRGVNGEHSRLIRTEDLLTAPHGMEYPDVSGFYSQLREYATARMVEESAAAGIDVSKLRWTDDAMSSQLPRYTQEFMDIAGVPQSQRHQLVAGIDNLRMKDYMDLLDPRERGILDMIQSDVNHGFDELTLSDEKYIHPTLADFAASRGFEIKYGVGDEPRFTLVHSNGESHPFSLSAEAIDFLKEYHAADADLLPGSFGDTGSASSTLREDGSSGANLTYDGAIRTAEETARVYDRLGGGGGGGSVPPLPPGGSGFGGQLPPGDAPVDVAGAIQRHYKERTTAYLETLSHVNSAFQRTWEPAIYRIMRLEENLTDRMQIAGATPYADVYAVSMADKHATSEAINWSRRFDAAVAGVQRKRLRRGGGFFEVAEMAPEYQEGVMDMLGWKPAEKEAMANVRQFWKDIRTFAITHPTNPRDIGELPSYMPHLRQYYSGQRSFNELPDQIKFFAEEAREGGIGDLETDVTVLAGRYIRGLMRQIYVQPSYDRAAALWNDERIPEELAHPVRQYLKDIYYGKTEVGTISLLMRDLVNTVGKPFDIKVTAQDVDSFTNFLLRMKYTSALGRMASTVRNLPQPLWTASEIGVKGLESFARFYFSPRYAREVLDRAFEKGWVERGVVGIEHADVFRPTRVAPSEGDPILTPEELARRGQMKDAVNAVFDAIPGNTMLVKALDVPMMPYGGVSHINRAVAGQAGYDWAWDGIREYDSNPDMTEDELIAYMNPGGTLARKPVVNEFLRLLRIGDREGAASFMGSQVADNQLRYGFSETPEAMRGDFGRLYMMFGRFSQQILRRYKDGLMAGSPSARARFAATQVAIVGILGYAAEKTGMKGLMSYNWAQSIFFGGGPAIQAVTDVAQSVGAIGTTLGGGNLSYQQQQSLAAVGQFNPAQGLNPFSGPMRDVEGLYSASQGPRPIGDAASVLITGRPIGPNGFAPTPVDINAWMNGAIPPADNYLNGILEQRQYQGPMYDTIDTGALPPIPGYGPAGPGAGGMY